MLGWSKSAKRRATLQLTGAWSRSKAKSAGIQTLVRWQNVPQGFHRAGVKRRVADKITAAVVNLLAQKRRELGVNYEELGGSTGLHPTSLSLIERQLRSPTFLSLSRIALALGVRLSTVVRKAEALVDPD